MDALPRKIPTFAASPRGPFPAALLLFLLLLFTSPACAAKVLIVGDTRYPIVADAVSEIRESLQTTSREYATADVKGRLGAIADREGAEVVVALGMEALAEALRLAPSIAVVYGLVVAPPPTGRANLTGVYISPPVSEYLATVRNYFPALAKVSVVGSRTMLKNLSAGSSSQVAAYHVDSCNELVDTVNRLADLRALLLLPDVNLLTAPVMFSVHLFSFKNKVPVLGVTEAHVKQGSLFALVFDVKSVSRQIGEKVQQILNGVDAGEIPASPPRKYHLYLNGKTADKMSIGMPDELLKKAKRVYR